MFFNKLLGKKSKKFYQLDEKITEKI